MVNIKEPVEDSLQLWSFRRQNSSPENINQDARIYAGRLNKGIKRNTQLIGKA